MSNIGQSARRRFTAAWVVVIVFGGCVWWGLHPPRAEQSYRQQSANTVELFRSNVETARIWLVAMRDGKVTRPQPRSRSRKPRQFEEGFYATKRTDQTHVGIQ